MYAEGIPPWQIDRPQSEVLRLIEQGGFESPVLDVGCGTGDNAIELARRGYRVVGLDAVEEALRRARKKVRGEKFVQPPEFVLGDALRLADSGLEVRPSWTALFSTPFRTKSNPCTSGNWRGFCLPGGGCTCFVLANWKRDPRGHDD